MYQSTTETDKNNHCFHPLTSRGSDADVAVTLAGKKTMSKVAYEIFS